MSVSSVPDSLPHTKRLTRWKIADKRLTRGQFEKRLSGGVATRYVAMIHDRDPGADPHLHGAFELASKRTRTAVAKLLGVPVHSVVPVYATNLGSKFAFAEATEYFLHPEEELLRGKAQYFVEEAFVMPGYDWLADLDAMRVRRAERRPGKTSKTELSELTSALSKSIIDEVEATLTEHGSTGFFMEGLANSWSFMGSKDGTRDAFVDVQNLMHEFAKEHSTLWAHKGGEVERLVKREQSRMARWQLSESNKRRAGIAA